MSDDKRCLGNGPGAWKDENPSPEELFEDRTMSELFESLNHERIHDLGGVSWEEYLLYVLEVDWEDVNGDGLGEIAAVFRELDQ